MRNTIISVITIFLLSLLLLQVTWRGSTEGNEGDGSFLLTNSSRTESVPLNAPEIESNSVSPYGKLTSELEKNRLDSELVQKRIYQNNDEKLAGLHPDFQPVARYFIELIYQLDFSDIGLPGYMVMITEGYRSIERQNLLFRKGGVTLALGGQSWHNYGLAIDVTAKDPETGNTLWELPANIRDKVAVNFYRQVAEIGKDLGLIWGGDFSSLVDMPHFEWHPNHIDINFFLRDPREMKRGEEGGDEGQAVLSRGSAWEAQGNSERNISLARGERDVIRPVETAPSTTPSSAPAEPDRRTIPLLSPSHLTYTYWPAGDPWPFNDGRGIYGDMKNATAPPKLIEPLMIPIEGGPIRIIITDFRGEECFDEIVEISDLFIGKYPVTNREFREFVLAGGYEKRELWTANGWEWKIKRGRERPTWWSPPADYSNAPYSNHDDAPVVGISWYEAVAYCNWLSISKGLPMAYDENGELKAESRGYRLPTEAEWEYIVEKSEGEWAGLFPGSDEPSSGERTDYGGRADSTTSDQVFDMTEQMWEWCTDWHKEYSTEGKGGKKRVSPTPWKVIRSSSWPHSISTIRSSSKNYNYPEYAYHGNIGFRVAIDKLD